MDGFGSGPGPVLKSYFADFPPLVSCTHDASKAKQVPYCRADMYGGSMQQNIPCMLVRMKHIVQPFSSPSSMRGTRGDYCSLEFRLLLIDQPQEQPAAASVNVTHC